MYILVIVESPSKAKTILKYLNQLNDGHKYKVVASMGHVRDLPKDKIGIDIEKDFKPSYCVIEKKESLIKTLRKDCKDADKVYIASDNDREGEAIAWHLLEVLDCKKKYARITFNEITQKAIHNAVQNPRTINSQLVDAQQARRVLDRLVGYSLTPILWKQFTGAAAKKLSAGRVQSAALRILTERETTIKNHQSSKYWSFHSKFDSGKQTIPIEFKLVNRKVKETFKIKSSDDAKKKMILLSKGPYRIASIDVASQKQNPKLPYITSTLQQEAQVRLGFSIQNTMRLAQDLYEHGYITYMRTDSPTLSKDALEQCRTVINQAFGEAYHEHREGSSKKVKNAQEAHEAIRPTNMTTSKLDKSDKLTDSHIKLYKLIWVHTLQSQMKAAIYDELSVLVLSKYTEECAFIGKIRALRFDGWKACKFSVDKDDTETHNDEISLKGLKQVQQSLQESSDIKLVALRAPCSFETASPRFTEATLIKCLETDGIGRPSTYATILQKLYEKSYIEKKNVKGICVTGEHFELDIPSSTIRSRHEEIDIGAESNKLCPTDIGIQIIEFLSKDFNLILEKQFTAIMESGLDDIAAGSKNYITVLASFWKVIEPKLKLYDKVPGKKTEKQSLASPVHNRNINGESVTLRHAKFGPVIQIENPKKFIDLKPYLQMTKKGLEDLDNDEVKDLIQLPQKLVCDTNYTVHYGKYGYYLNKDGINYNIPYWIAKKYSFSHLNVRLLPEDLTRILEKKADSNKKRANEA